MDSKELLGYELITIDTKYFDKQSIKTLHMEQKRASDKYKAYDFVKPEKLLNVLKKDDRNSKYSDICIVVKTFEENITPPDFIILDEKQYSLSSFTWLTLDEKGRKVEHEFTGYTGLPASYAE